MKQPVKKGKVGGKGALFAGALTTTVLPLSVAGEEHLTRLEGERLTAYADPATKGDPWTICKGATGWIEFDGQRVRVTQGMTLTRAQCKQVDHVIAERTRLAMSKCITYPLNQNQSNAVIIFAINVGTGGACGSTPIRLINAGDFKGAAIAMTKWSCAPSNDPRYPHAHCGKKRQMPGLLSRRQFEGSLLLKPDVPFQPDLDSAMARANAKLLEDAA